MENNGNKDLTEKEIQEYLEVISDNGLIEGKFDLPKLLQFFAKLLYNLRYDLNQLKEELIKFLRGEEEFIPPIDEDHGGFYS